MAPSIGRMLLSLAFSCCALGCDGASEGRESASNDFRAVRNELSSVLWGAPSHASSQDEDTRAFDCVWEALSEGGHDPEPELRCVIRHIEGFIGCRRHQLEGCETAADEACTFSPPLAQALQRCPTRQSP